MLETIIKELNDAKILQKYSWEDSVPTELYEKHLEDSITIWVVDISEHRWYETSIEVLRIPEGIIWVKHISKMYSESSSYEDMYHTLQFFEMEEIQISSYKCK